MTARTFSRRTDLTDTVYAADVNELQSAIETMSVVYNAVDFGITTALSGSAMSTAINGALTTINAAGGGTLVFHEGTFSATTGITLKDKVHLRGSGVDTTTLNFSGLVTPVSSSCMYGAGTLTDLTATNALNAAVSADGLTLTFTSTMAGTLSAGDLLIIYDSTNSSFNTAQTYYRAGEFVTVQSVSTVTVTLTNRTYAGYASTVAVYKVTPITTSMRDMSVVLDDGDIGIKIDAGRNCRFENLKLSGSDISNLTLARCFDSVVRDVVSTDYQAAIGYNYGLTISNCQRLIVSGGMFVTSRHGITMGGDGAAGCVPNREVLIDGALVSGWSTASGVSGANLHGNVEDVHWRNCILPNGITIAGDRTSVKGCTIRTGPSGQAVVSTEMLGWEHDVSENVITVTNDHGSSNAFVRIESSATLTRTGNVCTVSRNTVDCKGYDATSGSTRAIYIYNNGGSTSNDVVADGNVIRSTLTAAQTAIGVYVRGGFRNVRIADNDCVALGVRAEIDGADVVDLIGNTVYKPVHRGVHLAATGSAVKFANVLDNTVYMGQHIGIDVTGTAATTVATVRGNTAVNCAQTTTGSSATNVSIYMVNLLYCVYANNTVGDNQGSPTQNNIDGANTIATFMQGMNTNIGAVVTTYRNAITAYGIGSMLTGSKTHDWASIGNGAEATTTVTVTGAALGDDATFAHGVDLAGLKGSAYVSAANTVTVVLRNDTGGAVDLASSTLRAFVRKRV